MCCLCNNSLYTWGTIPMYWSGDNWPPVPYCYSVALPCFSFWGFFVILDRYVRNFFLKGKVPPQSRQTCPATTKEKQQKGLCLECWWIATESVLKSSPVSKWMALMELGALLRHLRSGSELLSMLRWYLYFSNLQTPLNVNTLGTSFQQ